MKSRYLTSSITITAFIVGTLIVASPTQSQARGMVIYPQHGQSLATQSNDESECRSFASRHAASDPNAGRRILGGTAVGSLMGLAIGSFSAAAGAGAAIGAIAGGGLGVLKSAGTPSPQARAFVACMTGRGYVVN